MLDRPADAALLEERGARGGGIVCHENALERD